MTMFFEVFFGIWAVVAAVAAVLCVIVFLIGIYEIIRYEAMHGRRK